MPLRLSTDWIAVIATTRFSSAANGTANMRFSREFEAGMILDRHFRRCLHWRSLEVK